MKDMHTKTRRQWVNSVSPFHIDESRARYMLAWFFSLIFGTKMPHEKR